MTLTRKEYDHLKLLFDDMAAELNEGNIDTAASMISGLGNAIETFCQPEEENEVSQSPS